MTGKNFKLDLYTVFTDLNFIKNHNHRTYVTNQIVNNLEKINSTNDYNNIISLLKYEDFPIEYIFNQTTFFGYDFYVDKRCLIPRAESEKIVTLSLKVIRNLTSTKKICIIDIGSGSGNILISIIKQLKANALKYEYIAIEKSADAIEVLKINLKRFGLLKIVNIKEIDFRDFEFNKIDYDCLITANLPYIGKSDYIEPSVIKHEPFEALFGGENGEELNNQLIKIFKDSKNLKYLFYETKKGKIITKYK